MSDLEAFIASPHVKLFKKLRKEHLLKLVDHYGVELQGENLKKVEIKSAVEEKLVSMGLLSSEEVQPVPSQGLTFQQQKELLLLQLENNKQQMEIEKLRLRREDRRQLQEEDAAQSRRVDVSNLRWLPPFNEKDPDTFFLLFERVSKAKNWSESECAVMLQSVFTGKAQQAYSALSEQDCLNYITIKSAVLKAYELVPEAYRQRFRSWEKKNGQTYVEFARDLTIHFKRWLIALDVSDFDELCDLIVLEQLKNTLPERLATYLNERKVETASEAAALADEYILIHKSSFKERAFVRTDLSWKGEQNAGVVNAKTNGKFRSNCDSTKICNYCREKGHFKADCPVLNSKNKTGRSTVKPAALAAPVIDNVAVSDITPACCDKDVLVAYAPFIREGFLSLLGSETKIPIKILRDTGAHDSYVVSSVLPFSSNTATGDFILSRGMGLTVLPIPVHEMVLECELLCGPVSVGVRPALPIEGIDVILGNGLAGSRVWADSNPSLCTQVGKSSMGPKPHAVSPGGTRCPPVHEECPPPLHDVMAVCAVTRARHKAELANSPDEEQNLLSLAHFPLHVNHKDLVQEQRSDPTLISAFDLVVPADEIDSLANGYLVKNDVLFRKWTSVSDLGVRDAVFQLVVPSKFRPAVLKLAHDETGHFGVRKTYVNLLKHFFWSRVKKDVSAYIKTCHVCQLTGKPNQKIKPAPLQPIPAVSEPFEYLIIDCVGPLPVAKSGGKYLLTVMCQSTRYPAAYPLRSITTKAVVKALSQFISVFGIPKVIQSDRGSNFSSHMFAQVLKTLGITHNQSTAYHAQSQGALERFHQTLKSLLRAYSTELDGDWEEGLPWLMLAAREVVQESTGFSPNELVFGHSVRGPLAAMKNNFLDSEPPKNLLDFVNGFRHRLFKAGCMAKEKLQRSQKKMKNIYDRRTEVHEFSPGDQVLALTPIVGSPFQAKFNGPYTVKKKVSELNYLIATPGRKKSTQLCHINLLKPYYQRGSVRPALAVDTLAVAQEDSVPEPDDSLLCGRLKNSESLEKLDTLLSHLSDSQRVELSKMIRKYPVLFGDVPSRTTWIEHDIDVGNAQPIKQRFYRMAPKKLKYLDAEIDYMVKNNIARPSSSSWASPCILVPKPDDTARFCTDMRKVNSVTKSDCFPLPRMEDCIDRVGSANFVSKFDLLKGYWQVPLSKRAQEIAAFVTPSGLYSYTVMPFGLKNAPATFQRLMNKVVAGLEGCSVYLDDVVIYSDTWHSHVQRICALFERLADARLTVNLAKCEFAKATVTYLGRVVGQGKVAPVHAKILAVGDFPPPTTKKELQRFLGLVGYYRSFCKNFSTIVFPLTELLKARAKFIWSSDCQQAFENVKTLLCSHPVLSAPCFDRPFMVQADASQVGAGAVLLQQDDQGVTKPVCFFSKKFNKHQSNYSVIEKEALALIWALQHFEVYLSGSAPLVVYTDHNPLTFLLSLRCPNQRLVRWSLFLQAYDLDIRHIKGHENVMADALSRAPLD